MTDLLNPATGKVLEKPADAFLGGIRQKRSEGETR